MGGYHQLSWVWTLSLPPWKWGNKWMQTQTPAARCSSLRTHYWHRATKNKPPWVPALCLRWQGDAAPSVPSSAQMEATLEASRHGFLSSPAPWLKPPSLLLAGQECRNCTRVHIELHGPGFSNIHKPYVSTHSAQSHLCDRARVHIERLISTLARID